MVIATIAGVGLTILVGTGLMGLVFLSNRSGHDDEANRRTGATMTETRGEPILRVAPRPGDINANGHIFGGWVLSQMDIAAGIVASREAEGPVATVAIDAMEFIAPILLHDVISVYAKVERLGRTSMSIRIEVIANRNRGYEEVKVTEGVFTFVALDENHRPRPVKRGLVLGPVGRSATRIAQCRACRSPGRSPPRAAARRAREGAGRWREHHVVPSTSNSASKRIGRALIVGHDQLVILPIPVLVLVDLDDSGQDAGRLAEHDLDILVDRAVVDMALADQDRPRRACGEQHDAAGRKRQAEPILACGCG